MKARDILRRCKAAGETAGEKQESIARELEMDLTAYNRFLNGRRPEHIHVINRFLFLVRRYHLEHLVVGVEREDTLRDRRLKPLRTWKHVYRMVKYPEQMTRLPDSTLKMLDAILATTEGSGEIPA